MTKKMRRQDERMVVITGASSGIGKACAEYLAERGYRVFGTSRNVIGVREEWQPGKVVMVRMDVNDEDSVRQAIKSIMDAAGRIDVLVNCAGFGIAGAVEDTSITEAKGQFETNFFGVWRLCQQVLPIMRKQRGGWIVNISSIGGLIGIPFQAAYSASKAALEGFSEALSAEVRSFGIRVVLIEPGDIRTNFTENRVKTRESQVNPVYQRPFSRALGEMEKAERTGPLPAIVAPLLERIITDSSPRLRYRVGPALERFAVVLKGLLPSRLFESILMLSYGLSPRRP